MFWFKNFRIRRVLCDHCLMEPSVIVVVNTTDAYRSRQYFCSVHEHKGLYWAGVIGASAKVYRDTGARS